MKKLMTIAILFVFILGVASAFADQDATGTAGSTGKPLSKVPGESSFQAAADHIALWGKSAPMAQEESLRGNAAELEKRRDTRNPMM